MRPGLLVKYTRWQQIRDNKKHFAAKNLHYSVDKICNLNYMGDSSPFHTMDIYSPKDRQDVLPVVMLIHGGGYVACEKFINACQAQFLAERGFHVVNINYSLMPEVSFFEVVRELFAALHWIESNAEAYGFDPEGICVSGDSGGGHYTLLVAAVQNSNYLQSYFGVTPVAHGIRGIAASCPMTELRSAKEQNDMTSRFLRKNALHSGRVNDDTFIDNVSFPAILDKCAFPHIFLLTTPTDPLLYTASRTLHEQLDARGIQHVYREYTSAERELGHVFNVVNPEFPESIAANEEILEYFKAHIHTV